MLQHNATLLRCSAGFKEQASKIGKEETEGGEKKGIWQQEAQNDKRKEEERDQDEEEGSQEGEKRRGGRRKVCINSFL